MGRELDEAMDPGFDDGLDSNSHGMLILENEQKKHHIVWAEDIAQSLATKKIRVVVLNTCQSGQQAEGPIFEWSGLAAALLEAGIPAVVGMQKTISDPAAQAFAVGFYWSLASGGSLDEAVAEGRKAILDIPDDKFRDRDDWAVPVLYLRSQEGVVFKDAQLQKSVETKKKKKRSTRKR